jgi:preprotein translocase subunit SecD
MMRFTLGLAFILLLASPAAATAQAPTLGERIGGVELVLEARIEAFARARREVLAEAIGPAMRAHDVEIAESSTADGQLAFRVADPARVDQALQIARTKAAEGEPAGAPQWEAAIAGGNRIVMRQTPAGLEPAVGAALDAARGIILERLGAIGARDPSVVRQGSNRLLVRAPGVRDPASVRALLGRTGRLELRLVDQDADQAQLAAGQAPPGTEILPFPDYGDEGRVAVQRRVILTGERIAEALQDFDPNTGMPVVTIRFDQEGSRLFARATADNVNRQLAIVVDGAVITAPNINEPILGGTAQIAGNFTVESAGQLVIMLRSGALPIGLEVIEERALPPR